MRMKDLFEKWGLTGLKVKTPILEMDWERQEDIVAFAKKSVEPLPPCFPYGERYRVAATLNDGTYLPCVVVESASQTVDLAIKRFEETREKMENGDGSNYH